MSFLGPKIWELLPANMGALALKIQKVLIPSNQILNLGSLKTVHAVCAGYILQT